MTTRAHLLAIIRESLADTTQWPDATINAWIAAAIKDDVIRFGERADDISYVVIKRTSS